MSIYRRMATALLGVALLAGCTETVDMDYLSLPIPERKGMPSYDEFMRNRKECKRQAESFCSYPLSSYCTLDVYEKRMVFIKNCMHERGWNDPYNMFSYYK